MRRVSLLAYRCDDTVLLPQQRSQPSPALFAIYIADIHGAVEDQVENSRGISYVDDVTWVAEGASVDDVVDKLERCAQASLEWADKNEMIRHHKRGCCAGYSCALPCHKGTVA